MSNGLIVINVEWYQIWAFMKLGLAGLITWKELQYPIWQNGVQVKRKLYQIIRAYGGHVIFNPEWAIIKLLSFIPIYIFTGKRYIYHFLPWRVKTPPPWCSRCKDKGQYWLESFLAGQKGSWNVCDCQSDNPIIRNDVECLVCLDTGKIGPKRVCSHCERRGQQKSKQLSKQLSKDYCIVNGSNVDNNGIGECMCDLCQGK